MLSVTLFLDMVWLTESITLSMRRSVPGPPPLGATVRRIFMSDALCFAEIDEQHAELLPARTVMSMFSTGGGCTGGDGGVGGNGGNGQGGIGINLLNINLLGSQTNSAGNGVGGAGGSANGGNC
jgi:hypothetical protein